MIKMEARALLLLGVCLVAFCQSVSAQCSAAEAAALLKFKSVVLDPRDDLATWTGPAGANCCSWRVRLCLDIDRASCIRSRAFS